MARDVIDQLSLNIDIDVDKQIDVTINNLADAIKNLNAAVADVSNLNAYVQALKQLSNAATRSPRKTAMGNIVGGKDTPQLKTEEVNVESSSEATLKNAEKSNNVVKETIKNTKTAQKQVNQLGKNTKKTTGIWSKFMKSLGRIALYRAVRSILKGIADTMREGIQNYAQYSDSANRAISNIQNSFGQLKNTLGVTLGYALEALEPIITAITDSLVKLIDNVNIALASISGKSSYSKAIKQNEDYAKSLKKVNSQLLSFDKFEVLKTGDDEQDPNKMFEEAQRPTELSDTAQIFASVFEVVKSVFGAIKDIFNEIKPILQEFLPIISEIFSLISRLIVALTPLVVKILKPIFNIISSIWSLLEPIFNLLIEGIELQMPALEGLIDVLGNILDFIGNISDIFKGAFQIIGGLLKLLTGDFRGFWDNIKKGFATMVNGTANAFISLYNFIINILNLLLKPVNMLVKGIGKILGKDWDITIPTKDAINWQPFANGGEFTKGTAFIAGEAGAEIVYNTRGGNGGVANIDQIREAEYLGTYQALMDYGAARGDLSSLNGMSVVLDGKKVGQLVAGSVIREGKRVGYLSATR